MIHIKNLNQFYGESHILWDVNLSVPPGICTCLMGRNGAGKTTLLNTLMGLLPKKSGTIEFDGDGIGNRAVEDRAHLGIGYVPQGREIFPQLTVQENLDIGLLARSDGVKEVPDLIFEYFPVLKKMLKRRGGDLSGGQQQQLAIGRALAIDPKLLILDEPTEGIQPNIVHEIGNIIVRLNQEQKLTVLLVEQKLPFAQRVAQRFCVLDNGRSAATGTIEELSDEIIQRHLKI